MRYTLAFTGCMLAAALTTSAPQIQAQQTFYVDFDTIAESDPETPGRPSEEFIYEYSAMQREFILGYLNENLEAYGMLFVPGTKPAPGFGSNITLNAGAGAGAGAEQIDFRNLDDGDDAKVNTLSIFKTFLGVTEFTDDDVMIATANAAGHEALHLLGMRHHDKCSPLGTGIGGGIFPSDFAPTYPGPAGATAAVATFSALHADGALSFSKLTTPKIVSERVIPRLVVADMSDFTATEAGDNNTLPMAEGIAPMPFARPYPLGPAFKGDLLSGKAFVVIGTLDTPGAGGGFASDYYEFFGEAGEVWTIEAMSYILPDDDSDGERYFDNADVGLILLAGFGAPAPFGPGTVIPYHSSTAITDDDDDAPFVPSSKPFDNHRSATLFDVVLPYTGPYVIEVAVAAPFFGTGKDGTDGGNYELFMYTAKPTFLSRCSPADLNANFMHDADDYARFDNYATLGIIYEPVPEAGDAFADFTMDDAIDFFDHAEFLNLLALPCPSE